MKIHVIKLISLAILVLTACVYIPTSNITSTLEPTTFFTTTPDVLSDVSYCDGIVVITQYYTFLGHGLHEEAYWLLSTSEQNRSSFDDYVKNTQISFTTVEIISVQPYYLAVRQQEGQITPEPTDKRRFVAKIRAWGEGNMSGSVTNGTLQTLFLTLVRENNKWKIDSFATAPLP